MVKWLNLQAIQIKNLSWEMKKGPKILDCQNIEIKILHWKGRGGGGVHRYYFLVSSSTKNLLQKNEKYICYILSEIVLLAK